MLLRAAGVEPARASPELSQSFMRGLILTATDGVFRICAAATTETTRLPCTSLRAEA